MANLDGYIGLAPDDPSNGPSYIGELKMQGLIDDKIVSIDLNPYPETSTITIGGLDSKSASDSQILYYDSDKKNWKLELWDFKIGDESMDGTINTASVDTFFRPILVPATAFDKFATYITKKHNFVTCNTTVGNCYFLAACSKYQSLFENITVQLADTNGLIIEPSSYLIDKKTAAGADGCLIGV
jgi:hypothetical protein